MLFFDFAKYLDQIERISSRTEITEILVELFSKSSADEIDKALYLILGRIAPKYKPIEFNFSTKLVLKSLSGLSQNAFFSQEDDGDVTQIFKEEGDVGKTVEKVLDDKEFKSENLDISTVFALLLDIANVEGTGSQGIKIERLQSLFRKISSIEGRFIGRVIVGKLRLGVNEKTILDALSWYIAGDKSLRKILDRAYGVRADIGEIGRIVLSLDGKDLEDALSILQLTPGIPVAAKLVEREKTTEKIFERMGVCFVQPKLDGLRIQLHKWMDHSMGSGGKPRVELFSRNLENMTHMFPELVQALSKVNVDSIVLDSEVIGINLDTGEYLPFQETIQRKRKHGVDSAMESIPVKAEIFDILSLNGKDLTDTPIEERIFELGKFIKQNESPHIGMLSTVEVEDVESLEQYYVDAIGEGLEGVIVKAAETIYNPGSRNYDWIKLKASARKDMVDTVDAVVMGYYVGGGKRSKFGIGAILIGIQNDDGSEFMTLAKVGTGITDVELVKIKSDLDEISIDKPSYYLVDRTLEPDVYVKPEIVVVVEADEITRSTMHTASIDKEGRGLSLRFPRLIEWNRVDKDISMIDSSSSVEKLFNLRQK